MLNKAKKWLTSSLEGKRIVHYLEYFAVTFALTAITFAEAASKPWTWSTIGGLLLGAAAAGGKAVIDIAKPLIVGWLTSKAVKGA